MDLFLLFSCLSSCGSFGWCFGRWRERSFSRFRSSLSRWFSKFFGRARIPKYRKLVIVILFLANYGYSKWKQLRAKNRFWSNNYPKTWSYKIISCCPNRRGRRDLLSRNGKLQLNPTYNHFLAKIEELTYRKFEQRRLDCSLIFLFHRLILVSDLFSENLFNKKLRKDKPKMLRNRIDTLQFRQFVSWAAILSQSQRHCLSSKRRLCRFLDGRTDRQAEMFGFRCDASSH